jgi:hypothetical protein
LVAQEVIEQAILLAHSPGPCPDGKNWGMGKIDTAIDLS